MNQAQWVFHPFLFAGYAVLNFYVRNTDITLVSNLPIPMLAAMGLALAAWGAARLFCKETRKAGLVATLFLIMFFSYGHLFGNSRLAFPVWCVLFLLGAHALTWWRYNAQGPTVVMNVFGAVLISLPLAHLAHDWVVGPGAQKESPSTAETPSHTVRHRNYPDIYYIILDGYARTDTLREIYGYDNSEFMSFLMRRGFYVASQSRSNYAWTLLSLTSSLNMDYLPAGGENDGPSRARLFEMLRNTRVEKFLRTNGYAIHRLDSAQRVSGYRAGMREFSIGLLSTTMLSPLADYLTGEAVRTAVLGVLERLRQMPREPGPKFVLAHILSPHPPYVFGPRGDPKAVWDMIWDAAARRRPRYVDQLIFVNREIQRVLDCLLSESASPPVIVLQADHGPDCTANWSNPSDVFLRERMRILNAYYLPKRDRVPLYESVTPVNTFRLIFNCYFDARLEMLPDRSFFTPAEKLVGLRDVTEQVK